MASLPIRWIVTRSYCQATEEEERVAKALETAAPGGAASRSVLEGQFGNTLILLSRRIEGAEAIRSVWQHWDREGILASLGSEIDARVDDDGVLHFRLDKQKAYLGSLALARDADAMDVQVKLKAYPAKPEELRRVARSLVQGAK